MRRLSKECLPGFQESGSDPHTLLVGKKELFADPSRFPYGVPGYQSELVLSRREGGNGGGSPDHLSNCQTKRGLPPSETPHQDTPFILGIFWLIIFLNEFFK